MVCMSDKDMTCLESGDLCLFYIYVSHLWGKDSFEKQLGDNKVIRRTVPAKTP